MNKFQAGMSLLNSNGDIDATSLGYQYAVQTTSQIRAKVIQQKFYKVPPAEFMSIIPGQGVWMEEIKTNLVYDVAGAFESGLQSTASNEGKIAQVDVGTSPVSAKINTWVKGYMYAVPEVQKALAANNWDVVSAKMEALKRNWDLGIQKIAFLGLLGDLTLTPGLLTNPNVNTDTSTITKNISTMSSSEFATFVAAVIKAYVSNSNYTAMPNTFVMPLDDFLGLVTPVASGFPVVSQLTYLENAFKAATGNQGFKILPLAYANQAQNAGYINGATGKYMYVLYNNEMETLAMDLPVDFTLTPAGTKNNFQFEGVAAGQFTGCIVYRPAEVLYFAHT